MQDLRVASPATVSRCGMVFVDPEELKWMPYVKTWIKNISKNVSATRYSTIHSSVEIEALACPNFSKLRKTSLYFAEGVPVLYLVPPPKNSWDLPEMLTSSPNLSSLFVTSAHQAT